LTARTRPSRQRTRTPWFCFVKSSGLHVFVAKFQHSRSELRLSMTKGGSGWATARKLVSYGPNLRGNLQRSPWNLGSWTKSAGRPNLRKKEVRYALSLRRKRQRFRNRSNVNQRFTIHFEVMRRSKTFRVASPPSSNHNTPVPLPAISDSQGQSWSRAFCRNGQNGGTPSYQIILAIAKSSRPRREKENGFSATFPMLFGKWHDS